MPSLWTTKIRMLPDIAGGHSGSLDDLSLCHTSDTEFEASQKFWVRTHNLQDNFRYFRFFGFYD